MARSRGVDYYPYTLGASDRSATLYVTENTQSSSCLEPNMEVLSQYPIGQVFKVVKTVEIQLHRFDSLYESRKVPLLPDFMHIDVQGFEFEVLEGMGKCLDNVTCVEIESHLKCAYKGEKLFAEMKTYLEGKGFFLRDIQIQGVFEGEVLELNVFFCRMIRGQSDAKRQSLIRLWERLCNLPKALLLNELRYWKRYHCRSDCVN